ncbi:MAG: 23S rRNA (adenine(2503)-C(2))-methyltransferase RlmN [Dehalococcoidales bacterium]|nr:23S rRNA (adenine(2503)-C(2))-methyltransferase RlmN [Dehalococcoidales bacterium]
MSLVIAPVRILDLTVVQLQEFMKFLGEPTSSADQILKYIYRECAADFEEMTGLSPSLRQKLKEHASIGCLEQLEEKVSSDAQTRKVLFGLADNNTVESTLMYFRNPRTGRERRTVCVSSQVGCSVGCRFCATGQQGFVRNLSMGEIIHQILFFMRRFRGETTEPVKGKNQAWLTNVVLMGMGEPLANYDNVCQAIAMLNSPKGMGLGSHQVTLSTAGLVPQIRQIAGEGLHFQLAVSLHAASDKLRSRLVPINRKYPLEQLIFACKDYINRTRRNIFIEYALFDGVNDSTKDADELVRLLDGLKCSINLILGNPIPSQDFQPASLETAFTFQKKLIASGIRTMLRVSRGADIEAGCGQLRSRWLAKQSQP